jgi:hypothetical protein
MSPNRTIPKTVIPKSEDYILCYGRMAMCIIEAVYTILPADFDMTSLGLRETVAEINCAIRDFEKDFEECAWALSASSGITSPLRDASTRLQVNFSEVLAKLFGPSLTLREALRQLTSFGRRARLYQVVEKEIAKLRELG